jgi:hypothetical protein
MNLKRAEMNASTSTGTAIDRRLILVIPPIFGVLALILNKTFDPSN